MNVFTPLSIKPFHTSSARCKYYHFESKHTMQFLIMYCLWTWRNCTCECNITAESCLVLVGHRAAPVWSPALPSPGNICRLYYTSQGGTYSCTHPEHTSGVNAHIVNLFPTTFIFFILCSPCYSIMVFLRKARCEMGTAGLTGVNHSQWFQCVAQVPPSSANMWVMLKATSTRPQTIWEAEIVTFTNPTTICKVTISSNQMTPQKYATIG